MAYKCEYCSFKSDIYMDKVIHKVTTECNDLEETDMSGYADVRGVQEFTEKQRKQLDEGSFLYMFSMENCVRDCNLTFVVNYIWFNRYTPKNQCLRKLKEKDDFVYTKKKCGWPKMKVEEAFDCCLVTIKKQFAHYLQDLNENFNLGKDHGFSDFFYDRLVKFAERMLKSVGWDLREHIDILEKEPSLNQIQFCVDARQKLMNEVMTNVYEKTQRLDLTKW